VGPLTRRGAGTAFVGRSKRGRAAGMGDGGSVAGCAYLVGFRPDRTCRSCNPAGTGGLAAKTLAAAGRRRAPNGRVVLQGTGAIPVSGSWNSAGVLHCHPGSRILRVRPSMAAQIEHIPSTLNGSSAVQPSEPGLKPGPHSPQPERECDGRRRPRCFFPAEAHCHAIADGGASMKPTSPPRSVLSLCLPCRLAKDLGLLVRTIAHLPISAIS
jgi:hypothetical protein